MDKLVDLHTHSTASDGSLSPSELVRLAATTPLDVMALTDHDTLAGLPMAEAEAARQGLTLVRGCEISSANPFGSGEVHLLGLWLPRDPVRLAPLERGLADMRRRRDARNAAIAARLSALGLPVALEDAAALAGNGVLGRPHFAELLLRLGIVESRREAFERYLGVHGAAYVPRDLPPPPEAAALLASTGALVVLAHPGLVRCTAEQLEKLVSRLQEAGLGALEAWHSEHDPAMVRACVELGQRHHLPLSGGSDFHGASKPLVRLGRGHGNLRFTPALYQRLVAARQALAVDDVRGRKPFSRGCSCP